MNTRTPRRSAALRFGAALAGEADEIVEDADHARDRLAHAGGSDVAPVDDDRRRALDLVAARIGNRLLDHPVDLRRCIRLDEPRAVYAVARGPRRGAFGVRKLFVFDVDRLVDRAVQPVELA